MLGFEAIEPRDLLTSIALTPIADNTIFQTPAGNSDALGDLFAGETERGFGARRALLKFDVAGSLPAGAHIDSATLQLHVNKDLGTSSSFGVHLLKADWGEGTSDALDPGGEGSTATTNDATWTARFFGASPAENWTAAGGDFSSAASATTNVGGINSYQWTSAQLAADVQGWLNAPGTQFGWLLKVESEVTGGTAQRFDSRESTTASFRPMLTINYSLPNLPPTLDAITDPPAILEGAAAQTIDLANITAGAGESQSLMVTATSDNPTLIPTPNVIYTSPDSAGSLSYTPAADRSGSAKITVTVRDAGPDGIFNNTDDATFAQTFTVNVTAVNDAPALTAISDPAAILEDASLQTVNLSGISAGPFETQTITITATSDNPGLIPDPAINYFSPNTSGSLTYKPAPNQSGQAVITVKVQDNGGTANNGVDTLIRKFTVNVIPVNDPPTLNSLNDPPAILEDAAQQTIQLSGISAGPSETGQALTITATSSNPGLIPNPGVTYHSGDSTATLKYTPVADQAGGATITVKINDDGGTANSGNDTIIRTFTVNVTPVNDPPTLDPIDNPAAILENAGKQTIQLNNISAGPSETQVITITATSDNPALIPNPNVSYTSPFIAGSLSYTPAADRFGTANITVTVKDNGGTANNGIDTITRTFAVVVSQVNDPPTIDAITNPTPVGQDSGQQTVQLTGISAGPFETQDISVIASSDNPTLIPSVGVDYTSPSATGSLTYTSSAGQNGTAVITVTVRDAGLDGALNTDDDGITQRTFTVRVISPDEINHAPSFVAGTVQPVTDETGPVSQPGFATQISPGPPDESQQTVAFILNLSADDQKLFSAQPAVDSAGKLTFTPAPNAHGTAHITIQAKDNGGTALGGVDTSPSQEFDVVISKPHVWHNTRNGRDVDDDGSVVAQDVIAIINRINAKGSGKIPNDAPFGPPYYDVDNDGSVVAQDVLNVINFINAGHHGGEAPPVDPTAADAIFQSVGDNLLALTLSDPTDSTLQSRRR
ncbi:MAG TPA: Ig-like domain-containing protein [Pirellulaceae bacterium]